MAQRSDLQDQEPAELSRVTKAVLFAILLALVGLTWYLTRSIRLTVQVILSALFSGLFSYWMKRDRRKRG